MSSTYDPIGTISNTESIGKINCFDNTHAMLVSIEQKNPSKDGFLIVNYISFIDFIQKS